MDKSVQAERRSISKAAFRVMAGGVLALGAGLFNQVVIAATYGAGTGMDAYMTAIVIPSYFQVILISSLSFVFIPAFVKEEEAGKEEDAWALVGTFFWIVLGMLAVVALGGSLLSQRLIAISAPGFDPQKSALAGKMLSILMFSVPFSGLGVFTVGIQNARNRFFWPSVASAVQSFVNMLLVAALAPSLGDMALSWAYLFSISVQASITIVPTLRHGWKKTLFMSDPRVLEIGKLLAPLVFIGLFTHATVVLERYFASGLPEGQISYLGYANKISGIYVALLAASIAAAIFPAMARSYAQNGLPGLSEKNEFGLKVTFASALPSILLTTALATPLVSLFFERGAFRHIDTLGVSRVVFPILLSDVLLRMVANIIIRSSYILKDTLTPQLVSAGSTVLYIAFAPYFVARGGYAGLAWARVLQQVLYVAVIYVLLARKLPIYEPSQMLKGIIKYLLAAGGAYLLGRLAQLIRVPGTVIVHLVVGGLAGVGLYLASLYLADREMLISLLEMTGVQRLLAQLSLIPAQPGLVDNLEHSSAAAQGIDKK